MENRYIGESQRKPREKHHARYDRLMSEPWNPEKDEKASHDAKYWFSVIGTELALMLVFFVIWYNMG